MDYNDIINNGKLIYSSLPSDRKLREWTLNTILLGVSYYKKVDLTPIDRLVCELILKAGKKISKKELGLTLGFDVETTVFQDQKYYMDEAEVKMYQRILQQLIKWHLIIIETTHKAVSTEEQTEDKPDNKEKNKESYVKITKVGEMAIKKGYKFSFHHADIILNVNYYSSGDKTLDYTFPYPQELGIMATVTTDKVVESINPDTVDIEHQPQWKDRLLLQLDSNWQGTIYDIVPYNRILPMDHTNIDFKLFDYEGEYKLLAYHNEQYCPNLTNIINSECNNRALNYRIKKCLYYKLINDKNALFSYKNVISFWNNIEVDEYNLLLKDERVNWNDLDLFNLIATSKYNTNQTWETISSICPIEIIKQNLDKYNENFNWTILSRRFDIDYTINTPTYPWDYRTILSRPDITTTKAQQILVLQSTNDIQWDWDIVEKYITLDFIKNNIDTLNIDFYHLTSWLGIDNISLVLERPEKPWNWDKATNLFPIQQIADNLQSIENYVNIYYLLDKCFTDKFNAEYTIQSEKLKQYFKEAIKNGKLNSFSLKDKDNYIWTDETILFFEDVGLLKWDSKKYEKGFAQYPYVKWTREFFDKYNHKLTEDEDRAYVSGCINDISLISKYERFGWNWTSLSTNKAICYNEEFIKRYADYIDIASWIKIADTVLIEKYFDILHLDKVLEKNEVNEIISSKVSKNMIENHKELCWAPHTFTMTICSSRNIDTYLLDKYYSKWDWNLLSTTVTSSFILKNISYPWNAYILSRSICLSQDATRLIDENNDRLDWSAVSTFIKYNDFEDIAEKYVIYWNWDIINQRFTSNFTSKLLSIESIHDYVNWDDITEQINLHVLAIEAIKHPDKLNWEETTYRLCPILTIDMLLEESTITKWNWLYLTTNIDIKILKKGLEYEQLRWNWNVATKRMDATFITDNLITYQNYWDWDIIWSEKFNYNFIIDKIQLISTLLNQSNESIRKAQWAEFTKVICQKNPIDVVENYVPSDGYYWDYRYIYENVEDITEFISKPHSYIDWSALSSSNAANKYFHYDAELFDIRIWKNVAKKRLENPQYKWDYKSLTTLESIQQGYQVYFKLNPDKWDWDYISLNGFCLKTENNGEANLRKYKNKLNFALISKREDINLTEELIRSFIDEYWDWSALSANNKIKITILFVADNKEKEWDWEAISQNLSIKWDTKTPKSVYSILFKDKNITDKFDWNFFVTRPDIKFDKSILPFIHKYIINQWKELSSNKRFIPSIETLELAQKDNIDLSILNWDTISESKYIIPYTKTEDGHSISNLKFITEYIEYLNWNIVTQNMMFDIYNDSLLEKFHSVVDWNYISKELDIDKLTITYLIKFKEYLDWSIINSRIDYQLLNIGSIKLLQEYLDWTKVSGLELAFSKELLDGFSSKWNWNILLKNKAFKQVCTDDMLLPYKEKLNVATFLEQFTNSHFDISSVKVYHFTHIFNALEVLKNRRILSRNKACELGLLKYDSAGRVVGRTAKAHPYARFYFRPNTPTQFYNECLGWDSELTTSWGKSYYSEALNLGLPKCPIPIFLEFNLKEILDKTSSKCYYSDGNMQTNFAKVYKVEEQPNNLQMEYLYNNMEDAYNITKGQGWNQVVYENLLNSIRAQSQQEFLVKDEFDFSQIKSLKIHCYDNESARMLCDYLGDDPIKQNIVVGGCFTHNNKQLDFKFNDEEQTMTIESDYEGHGDAYFLLKGDMDIINFDCIKQQIASGVVMYPEVKIKLNGKPCEIHFIDNRARTTDWLIYSNNKSKPSTIKKQYLDEHIIEGFKEVTNKVNLKLCPELFYKTMLNSYHGIAHTSRVLFATYLIVNMSPDIDEETKRMSYYAAIIHDLGKTNDREGDIHGKKSVMRYESFINSLDTTNILKQRLKEAIQYHSVEDSLCPESVRNGILWKILKDADALDRSRFNVRGCDVSYLRMPIFKTSDGIKILDVTRDLPTLTKECEWLDPYNDIINALK